MTELSKARQLAGSMAAIAAECGVKFQAIVTNMDRPLGRCAGNWIEIKESVECLENCGPDDLKTLVIECAASLLVQTGKSATWKLAREQAASCLASGEPRIRWNQMLSAQGVDLAVFEQKVQLDHTAQMVHECQADSDGFVADIDARILGELVRDLGGGRFDKHSSIDPNVGIDKLVQLGEPVSRGALLGRIHMGLALTQDREGLASRYKSAFKISPNPQTIPPLILDYCPGV
jgi:thymidine phosphorylase